MFSNGSFYDRIHLDCKQRVTGQDVISNTKETRYISGDSAPGFFEKKIERETAARVAAFLGGLGRGSENLGATGVRSDWMEQDGPAFGVPCFEKMYENTGYRYSNMQ